MDIWLVRGSDPVFGSFLVDVWDIAFFTHTDFFISLWAFGSEGGRWGGVGLDSASLFLSVGCSAHSEVFLIVCSILAVSGIEAEFINYHSIVAWLLFPSSHMSICLPLTRLFFLRVVWLPRRHDCSSAS